MQKRILVYDDELEISNICKLVLERHDYHVEVRASCADVISDVHVIRPDLILMDLWIPEIGGNKAITILKKNPLTQHIPVILFSADSAIRAICTQVNAQGYLGKPFDIKTLVVVVEKHVL